MEPRISRASALSVALIVAISVLWMTAAAPIALANLPAECVQSGSTVTCTYTSGVKVFVVPSGVGVIHVVAVGGHGGDTNGSKGFISGGSAAQVTADLPVSAGQSVHVVVGGNANGGTGGANGGANGWGNPPDCGGGGGASDVRTGSDLADRILVAAGGGGAGCSANGDSGAAGGVGGDAGVAGTPATAGAYGLNGGGGQVGCQSSEATNCGAGGTAARETAHARPTAGGNGLTGSGGAGGGGSENGGGGGGGLFGGGGGGGASFLIEPCDGSVCPIGGGSYIVGGGGGGGGGGSSLVPTGGSLSIDTTGIPKVEISYAIGGVLPVEITSNAAPAGTVGDAYSFTYTASGDVGFEFAPSGNVPPGLTLAQDGALYGTPTTSGDYTFTVTATGSSGASAQRTDTIQIAPSPPAPPVVSLSPTSIDFGSQALGTTSASQTVTLTNTGGSPLTMTGILITPPDFAFGADCGVAAGVALDPGQSCAVPVTFTPSATGARSGSLTFTNDAADSPQTVSLSGTGTPPAAPIASVSPTSVDFGNQLIGTTSSAQTITLTNSGDASLAVSGLSLGPSEFRFADKACLVVPPGQSCSVSITFTPSGEGSQSGSLSFTTNAAGSPHTVSLSGNGVPPSADLAVSISASPNPAKSGSKVTYTITVLNAGPSAATNVLLNDALSSQSTFVSASIKKGQGTCVTPSPGASGTVSCNLGSIASGASNVTQIVVTVIAKKSTITNTATVSCGVVDPNTANNTASITTRVK